MISYLIQGIKYCNYLLIYEFTKVIIDIPYELTQSHTHTHTPTHIYTLITIGLVKPTYRTPESGSRDNRVKTYTLALRVCFFVTAWESDFET